MVRGEVEIDVCPRCRGVWLDRGEIDKLSGTGRVKAVRPKRDESRKRYDAKRDHKRDDRDDRDDKKRREDRKRRRKTFGEKIADVFDDILD